MRECSVGQFPIMPSTRAFADAPEAACMSVTPSTIRPPTLLDYGRLVLVSAIWGSAFLCNAIALEDFSPLAIAAYRVIGATVLIVIVCQIRSLPWVLDRRSLWLFLSVGLLNTAIPFSLIGWGQLSVDPGTTGILLAASPFATLLFSHYMSADDRFTLPRLIGLSVGFAGVVVLLSRGLRADVQSVPGMLAIVLAACCYALSGLLIRKLGKMPSLSVVAGTLVAGSIILVPLLLWFDPPTAQALSPSSVSAIVFLALVPTALAYVLRTQIVQTNGAVFMSSVGYLIPLFAVFWGWLFLDHTPSWEAWVALVLILAGIAIGQQRGQWGVYFRRYRR